MSVRKERDKAQRDERDRGDRDGGEDRLQKANKKDRPTIRSQSRGRETPEIAQDATDVNSSSRSLFLSSPTNAPFHRPLR